MEISFSLLAFLLAIFVVVPVHEWGHYWVARKMGVKVLKFSIGFGPVVYSKVGRDGTEWALSLFPLGGFVRMVDGREAPLAAGDEAVAFDHKSLAARSAIVAAGPIANLLLAVLLLGLVAMGGVEEWRPVLDAPRAGTLAEKLGINKGDELVKVGDREVGEWSSARWALTAAMGEDTTLEVRNKSGATRSLSVSLPKLDGRGDESDPLADMGFERLAPRSLEIEHVSANSPAERAGVRVKDRVSGVNGETVEDWSALVKVVVANPETPIELRVEREGKTLLLNATPRRADRNGRIVGELGVRAQIDTTLRVIVKHGPLDALANGVKRTYDFSALTLKTLWRMLTGQGSIKQISGPITMADYAGKNAQLGIVPYLNFLALISISLGVLNLLPIPMLDGGHLMYHLAELIKGKPLSNQSLEWAQRAGLAVVMLLMGIALFNDFSHYLLK